MSIYKNISYFRYALTCLAWNKFANVLLVFEFRLFLINPVNEYERHENINDY